MTLLNFDTIFQSVIRIKSEFTDDLGNIKVGIGTGFAIHHENQYVIVTNRHMLDYSYLTLDKKFSLSKLIFWCRTLDNSNLECAPTEFKVDLSKTNIISHPTTDLSIVIHPHFLNCTNLPDVTPIPSTFIADKIFFEKTLSTLDSCAFIGYPSSKKAEWWDTHLGLPIARLANLASRPGNEFRNEAIQRTHIQLVAGFSFSGSSGSPIYSLGSGGFRTKTGFLQLPNGIEPKLIGIMAGHFKDDASPPEMLQHTGLSYFISSDAILELLGTK